jgi:glyoxylase-like metal-dependent hydrolase (beta-lactamase superfamily II)
MLKTLAPGIHAWLSKGPARFRSFAVVADGAVVLVDPVRPDAAEAAALKALGPVVAILITCGWHGRDAAALAAEHGVPVWAHADALAALGIPDAKPFPTTLPGKMEALPATGSTPGQVAFYVPQDGGSLIVGDFWMNIAFAKAPWWMQLVMRHLIKVRDGLHLFPPVRASDPQAMIAASRDILTRPFERLLVSHGDCLLQDARRLMAERLKQGP